MACLAILLLSTSVQAEEHRVCPQYLAEIGVTTEAAISSGVELSSKCSNLEQMVILRATGQLDTTSLMSLGGTNSPFVLMELSKSRLRGNGPLNGDKLVGTQVMHDTATLHILLKLNASKEVERLIAYRAVFGLQNIAILKAFSKPENFPALDKLAQNLQASKAYKSGQCAYPIDALNHYRLASVGLAMCLSKY
jgi:hypothetical protein